MPDADAPAAPHWRRFRRLMALIFGIALITIVVALVVLRHEGVVLRTNFVIALSLAIGVSLLLAGALMGLIFVSASSGHDDEVKDFRRRDDRPKGPWER